MPKSIEITVAATWEDRVPARAGGSTGEIVPGFWATYGSDEPEMLRARLAPKRLTVWLPKGSRVVCRRNWRQVCDGRHTDRVFYHGWVNRHGEHRRIKFVIADDVPLNAGESKNV